MSRTQFVSYREKGFWAYDVALGVFLKHLIDVAEPEAQIPHTKWLKEAIGEWREIACLNYMGFALDESWTADRLAVLETLIHEACRRMELRESIPAAEIESWELLPDLRLFARGAKTVAIGPVVKLGQAIIDLLHDRLPEPPAGRRWIFGTEKEDLSG